MLFSILFSIFIFCIFITLEINLRFFRLKKTVSPIKIVSFSLTVFFFSILFSQFFFNYNFERYLVAFIYFMLFLILYLHLFIGIAKSVSLRFIDEINKSLDKELSLDQINSVYPINDFFNKRLKLLLSNNWIFIDNNKYKCSRKAKLLVKVNLIFLKLYNIKNSG
tara:strand:+ start:175 stop:669 length:495 start_codon:yes stop_codon:yes gene_type:complete